MRKRRTASAAVMAVSAILATATDAPVYGGPNLVANGDLEQPVATAKGRVSRSGREVYFEFPGEQNFGRVVLTADSVAAARQLASEFRVVYTFATNPSGRTWGMILSGKEVKANTNYETAIWFDLIGRIRPGAEYTYSVAPIRLGENGKIPAMEMIAPAVWVDGELVGARVSLGNTDGQQIAQVQNQSLRGVVRMPEFDVQTGGQWLILKLPTGFKDDFFLDAVSLREIETASLEGKSVRMPTPRRYVRIEDPLERRIASALSGAAAFLKSQQNQQGFWPAGDLDSTVAHTATVLAALGNQGEDLSSKDMRRAIKWLANQEWEEDEDVNSVAGRGARLTFLARYGLPEFRQTVAEDMLWLEDAQFEDGGWGEQSAKLTDDRTVHSNNLFSLHVGVALREAHYAGKSVSRKTWINAAKYWTDAQARDGGFRATLASYGGLGEATTTHMSGAGIAGMMLTLDMAFAAGSRRCDQYLTKRAQVSGLDQAFEWMDVNYDNFLMQFGNITGDGIDPFTGMTMMQYMLEYAGVTHFKGKDVFRNECSRVLDAYDSNTGTFAGNPVITANMLEALSNGSAPVVVQRIIVGGPRGAEYSRDADHLVQYMRRQRGRPVNWRVASFDSPIWELVRAPILYINVMDELKWSPEKWRKLRDYCFGGGVVLFNVSESASDQRANVEAGLAQAFGEFKLSDLADDDPILSVKHKLSGVDGMKVVGNGFKNFVYLPQDDWSCRMNLYQIEEHPEVFEFADNLLSYTLDHAPPRSNYAPSTWDQPTAEVARVSVARMEVGSATPAYPDLIGSLNRYMLAGYQLKVEDAGQASSGSPQDPALLWVSATGAEPLAAGEKAAIKSHIDRGGYLFADIVGGDPSSEEALRAELKSIDSGIEIRRLLSNHPVLSGRIKETQGFDVRQVQLRHALAEEFEKLPRAKMYLLERGGEEIGVLSAYDISSGQGYVMYPNCRGVMPEPSRQIAANVILYAMQRQLEM